MPARPLTSRSRSIRSTLPFSRHGRLPWIRTCAVFAALIAIYVLGYMSARRVHRSSDGRLVIYTGSQLSNRIFTPAIAFEKSLRDRPIPNPETALESYLSAARSSRRFVLVALGSKSCLPCRQLEHFLDEQQAIVSKYFVVMRADSDGEMSLGELIRDRYRTRSGTEGYINYLPWIAFLNGNGDLLVTADDGPPGQIGIPQGGPKDRAWFLRMLRIANPAITNEELATLDVAAEAYHELLWRDVAREDVRQK